MVVTGTAVDVGRLRVLSLLTKPVEPHDLVAAVRGALADAIAKRLRPAAVAERSFQKAGRVARLPVSLNRSSVRVSGTHLPRSYSDCQTLNRNDSQQHVSSSLRASSRYANDVVNHAVRAQRRVSPRGAIGFSTTLTRSAPAHS